MTDPFTPDQIDSLSAEIDSQLAELGSSGIGVAKGRSPLETIGERQQRAIEKATGEKASTFLKRFREAGRRDLCEEGGLLHKQWSKWRDVTNKRILTTFGAILIGMGLAGTTLQIVVVAVAVWVLYIGLQAFCAEA